MARVTSVTGDRQTRGIRGYQKFWDAGWDADWDWGVQSGKGLSLRACASAWLLAASRLVVGSSRARIPQLVQKVSASANRTMRLAST